MPQIEIINEDEQAGGWQFDCQVLDDAGGLHSLSLHLSWADYNLWSPDGADPPQTVAEAVLTFLLSKIKPEDVRPHFDAARVRTQFADADQQIPNLIRR